MPDVWHACMNHHLHGPPISIRLRTVIFENTGAIAFTAHVSVDGKNAAHLVSSGVPHISG